MFPPIRFRRNSLEFFCKPLLHWNHWNIVPCPLLFHLAMLSCSWHFQIFQIFQVQSISDIFLSGFAAYNNSSVTFCIGHPKRLQNYGCFIQSY